MTTRLPPDEYLKYWQAASEQDLGIFIQVEPDDQPKFVNSLYEARNTFGGFENIIVMQPPPLGTVYVMKKSAELPA